MLPDYILSHHLPPPAPLRTLTVSAEGRVYLSKLLLIQLDLRPGQPADLLPPSADCPSWQLDLRPTAARRLYWYADTRARLDGVRLPADLVPLGTSLLLALAPSDQTGPDLYPLTASPATTHS